MKIHEKKESAKLKTEKTIVCNTKKCIKIEKLPNFSWKKPSPLRGNFWGDKTSIPPEKENPAPPPLLTRIVYVCKRLTISIFCIICVFVFKLCDAHVAIKKWPGEYSIPPKVIF